MVLRLILEADIFWMWDVQKWTNSCFNLCRRRSGKFDRDSRIAVNGDVISHPIEANIWQMKLENQVEYLKSIYEVAGCNLKEEMPQEFVSWIYWKLGDKIAENYMIPYNQKMFGEIWTAGDILAGKIAKCQLWRDSLSCLTKAYGEQPTCSVLLSKNMDMGNYMAENGRRNQRTD